MIFVLKILVLLISVFAGLFDFYNILLASFSFFLLLFFFSDKTFNGRVFSLFFFVYLAIPFLNISEYRGTVSTKTLSLYCLMQFCTLLLVTLVERKKMASKKYEILSTKSTNALFWVHMSLVYLCVAYVYATIGFVIVRQDLRFNIPPSIEYVIKSGLCLPLIWIYVSNIKISLRGAFVKFLVPILPSLLIGSRGTFIMILIALFLSLFLFQLHGQIRYQQKYQVVYKGFRKFALLGVLLALTALYSGFYIRRDGSELITAADVLVEYNFDSRGAAVFAILPLYLGLREQVGITNRIVEEGISNVTDFPLFFSELLTPLPGHQVAPGIVLANDIYMAEGSDEKYSLTPGIVGGLYMDYQYLFLPIFLLLVWGVVWLYNRSVSDVRYGLLYAITVVQFFHLYHRGFLKIEYFVPYFVIAAFLFTLKRKRYI